MRASVIFVACLSWALGNASDKKTIAIIGGGVSGMVAARHLLDPIWGMTPTLYELSDTLGGTWIYTEKTGIDEYGIPIHTSMYKNLRTNLPKEIMMFPDFPHTKQGLSYISNKDVCQYLSDYAKFFNVTKCAKFRHLVKRVDRVGSQWKITVRDLKAGQEITKLFDYVIVAVGQTSVPKYPTIEGVQYFRGQTLHSHDYREPEGFTDLRVLLIGAGPSGLDMTFDLSTVSNHVVLSHHSKNADTIGFPPQVVLKPDVKRINRDGSVMFEDGTSMEFDAIVYCTGYKFSFPFLSESCGIKWDNKYVRPLHKRVININQPTMGVLGVVRHTTLFYIADLQVRFFLTTLVRPELIPSKKEMMEELEEFESQLIKANKKPSDFLSLYNHNTEYVQDICNISGITPMPILLKMYQHAHAKLFSDFKNFRNNLYKIVDQDNFTVVDVREVSAKPVVQVHDSSSCRILPNV